MATVQLVKVVERLRNVVGQPDVSGMMDGDLVKRYARQRHDAAFEALVRRHGQMVMGVCRRVLHDTHAAEDAFQATFLLLARKACTLRSPSTVGNWLYGVAYRTALEAKRANAKRRAKEASVVRRNETCADSWTELRTVLDEELDHLPEKYRAVVVLCDLEGKTRKEAAQHLGWPEGTVASRLATARTILAKRLVRHGLAVSGGALAMVVSQNASACVPPAVVSSTVKAASLVTAGKAGAAAITPTVAALMEGVMKAMWYTKLRAAIGVVLIIGFLACGATILSGRTVAGQDRQPAAGQPAEPAANQEKKEIVTAWGTEVGGLQAGLGVGTAEHRAYHHGETLTLIVRVRNVGKETVKFEYLRQFLDENPPTVTDTDGRTVPQDKTEVLGFHFPVEVSLAPGKEIELESRFGGGPKRAGASGFRFELLPAERGKPSAGKAQPLFATGKVSLQYERVFGNSSSGGIKLDPTLSKLATGKLELDIKSDPPAATEKNTPQADGKKPVDAKGVLVEAVRAARDIKAQDDEARRRKLDFLVSLAHRQEKAGDRAGAATTFQEALTVAGTITDSDKRADAQSNIGFYQAHAGLVKEAAQTAKNIAIPEGKLKGDALKHRVDGLQGHVRIEVASHLALTGRYDEALATAETIAVRVRRLKAKGTDKVVEQRDTMQRDVAYEHIAKAQLKAGKTDEAFKTLAKIEVWRTEVFLYQDILLAHGKGKDLAMVRNLVAAFKKEMEKREVSALTRHYVLADVQGALGDAAGAIEWIERLDSPQARAEALMGLSIGLSRTETKK